MADYSTNKDISRLTKGTIKAYHYEKLGILEPELQETINQLRETDNYPPPLSPLEQGEFNSWVDARVELLNILHVSGGVGTGPSINNLTKEELADLYILENNMKDWVGDNAALIASTAAGLIAPISLNLIPGGQVAGVPLTIAKTAAFIKKFPQYAKPIAAFIGGTTAAYPWSDDYVEALAYGATELAGESFVQVLSRTIPMVLKWLGRGKNAKNLKAGAAETQKIVEGEGKTLTAGQVSENSTIDLMENIAANALFGRGTMNVAYEAAEEATETALGKVITKELGTGSTKLANTAEKNFFTNFIEQASQNDINQVIKQFLLNGTKHYSTVVNAAYKGVDDVVKKYVGKAKIINLKPLKNIIEKKLNSKLGINTSDQAVKDLKNYINKLPDYVNFTAAKNIRSELLSKTGFYTTSSGNVPKYVNKIAGETMGSLTKQMEIGVNNLVKNPQKLSWIFKGKNTLKLTKGQADEILNTFKTANQIYKQGKKTFNTKLIASIIGEEGTEITTKAGANAADKVFDSFFKAGNPKRVNIFYKLLDDAVKEKLLTKEAVKGMKKQIQGEMIYKFLGEGTAYNVAKGKIGEEGANKFITALTGFSGKGREIINAIFKGNEAALQGLKRYARALKSAAEPATSGQFGSLFVMGSQFGALGTLIYNPFDIESLGPNTGTAALSALVLGGPKQMAKLFSNRSFVQSLVLGTIYKPGSQAYSRATFGVLGELIAEEMVDPSQVEKMVTAGVENGSVDQKQAEKFIKNKVTPFIPKYLQEENDKAVTSEDDLKSVPEGSFMPKYLQDDTTVEEEEINKINDQNFLDEISGEAIVEETVSDRQPGLEEAVTTEEVIDIPEPNTEMMSTEVIQPLSTPAGMPFDPEMSTTDKLEEVGLPVFANKGGIMSLMGPRKPKQMVA